MLYAAKSECASVESLADFCRSPSILSAAEKTRSSRDTTADERSEVRPWSRGESRGSLMACYLASIWQLTTAPKTPQSPARYLPGSFKTKLLCGSFENPPVKHAHNIRHLTAFLIWANELLKVRAQTMFDRVRQIGSNIEPGRSLLTM